MLFIGALNSVGEMIKGTMELTDSQVTKIMTVKKERQSGPNLCTGGTRAPGQGCYGIRGTTWTGTPDSNPYASIARLVRGR